MHILSEVVTTIVKDINKANEIACLLMYELIANFVILPTYRVSKTEEVSEGQPNSADKVEDDLNPLHFEIVFKLVTTMEEIQKRQGELQINNDYLRCLPSEIKDMANDNSQMQEDDEEAKRGD
jgi:hypothetical protein